MRQTPVLAQGEHRADKMLFLLVLVSRALSFLLGLWEPRGSHKNGNNMLPGLLPPNLPVHLKIQIGVSIKLTYIKPVVQSHAILYIQLD